MTETSQPPSSKLPAIIGLALIFDIIIFGAYVQFYIEHSYMNLIRVAVILLLVSGVVSVISYGALRLMQLEKEKSIQARASSARTVPLECPQCKSSLRAGAKFCDDCGAKV